MRPSIRIRNCEPEDRNRIVKNAGQGAVLNLPADTDLTSIDSHMSGLNWILEGDSSVTLRGSLRTFCRFHLRLIECFLTWENGREGKQDPGDDYSRPRL